MQWGQVVIILRVYVCAELEQKCYDVRRIIFRRQMQRRLAVLVPRMDIGTMIQ
jgi:hypothetical protein